MQAKYHSCFTGELKFLTDSWKILIIDFHQLISEHF